MTGDAIWYEAAQVVGITNALNVAADGLGALGPVDEAAAPPEARALLAEIRAFYGGGVGPPGFRLIAHDPAYAAEVWAAARHGNRRRDADVLELHEDRRHAPTRTRHGRHRSG